MMTVWKYALEAESPQTIQLPKGAKILSIQVQNGTPCMWCSVNTEADLENRIFHIFATGQEIPCSENKEYDLRYFGSFQIEGNLMFHVMEEK